MEMVERLRRDLLFLMSQGKKLSEEEELFTEIFLTAKIDISQISGFQ